MDEATEKIRQIWDQQAQTWFDQRESILADSRPVHEWLVRNAAPQVGDRLLEIAAGPGDTGFLAAPLLGSGRLVSTDIAPSMVEAARKRGAELNITNADFRVLDAQAMDLDSNSFDAAICRWGYMLMPDPAAALRETRRVLKPGGRLAFAVFAGPGENPWVSIPLGLMREAGYFPQPSPTWQPNILALADRARIQSLIDAAGFKLAKLESISMAWTFVDADAYWTFLEKTSAMGPIIRGLPEPARTALRTEIDARTAKFRTPERVALPALTWCGLAM